MPIPADPAAPENSAANNPMAWLENFERDFGMLPLEEKEAIKNFCLLWSVCEGQFLNRNANTKKIRGAVNKLAKRGHLSLEAFRTAIDHFMTRYWDGKNKQFTPLFYELRVAEDDQELVKKFIRGQLKDKAEILSALLIIVYRLRNNLFHGEKWTSGIRNQPFRHANDVLMAVVDQHTGHMYP
jgi:hypothetical protein